MVFALGTSIEDDRAAGRTLVPLSYVVRNWELINQTTPHTSSTVRKSATARSASLRMRTN
jgi:hypothetical protein